MRLVPLLSLALVACITAPTDGAETDEDEDVLDPAGDEDGDGLSNGDEEELGLDPYEADSDEDGFDDNEELDAGTNPDFEWSHPFEDGEYLVGNCPVKPNESASGPTGEASYGGTTWAAYVEGDILANIAVGGIDSYEQEVTAYAFCGDYTLITVSAEWCGPCQQMASTMAEETETVRKKYPNFTFFEYLYQDNYGNTSDKTVLAKWRKTYGLDGIPVVAPADQEEAAEEISALTQGAGIPSTTLLAPDMTVIWSSLDHSGEYYLSGAMSIKSAIKDYEDAQGE